MIMGWLRRFMYGRYGVDHLSAALMIAGLVFSLAVRLLRLPWLGIIYYAVLAYVLFRVLSRNIPRRQVENYKFLSLCRRARSLGQRAVSRLRLYGRMIRELRTHKYLKCPQCRQRLRVPRGKGKISVTCSRCRNSFVKKV